jgi:hypothetical protein
VISQKEESNVEGYIKIIDYVKKIECDEQALHNKMNPYNLLTPACFWFSISAEYYSYDFFNHGNPTEAAVDILKKCQKTHITLPQRILKPIRNELCPDFETRYLKEVSKPVTDKLINLIPNPPSVLPENTDRSAHLTSTLEDDLFRSSTRTILFNQIKGKLNSNERWSNMLMPRLKQAEQLPGK